MLHLLPTLWFRNTWSWGCTPRRVLAQAVHPARPRTERSSAQHATLGRFRLAAGPRADGTRPRLLFTENETNAARLFGGADRQRLCQGRLPRVRRRRPHGCGQSEGTGHQGRGALSPADCRPAARSTVRLRLCRRGRGDARALRPRVRPGLRRSHRARPTSSTPAASRPVPADGSRSVARQAYAGLLWTQAVLPLRRQGLARRRSGPAAAAGRAASRAATATGRTSTTAT